MAGKGSQSHIAAVSGPPKCVLMSSYRLGRRLEKMLPGVIIVPRRQEKTTGKVPWDWPELRLQLQGPPPWSSSAEVLLPSACWHLLYFPNSLQDQLFPSLVLAPERSFLPGHSGAPSLSCSVPLVLFISFTDSVAICSLLVSLLVVLSPWRMRSTSGYHSTAPFPVPET